MFSSISKVKSYLEKKVNQHILFKDIIEMIDNNTKYNNNEKEIEFGSTDDQNMEVELVYCYIDEN